VPTPVRVESAVAEAAGVRPGGPAGRPCLERSARRARRAQAQEPVEGARAGRAAPSERPERAEDAAAVVPGPAWAEVPEWPEVPE
jgi:hypothetical protein